jgi:hypothetical protein
LRAGIHQSGEASSGFADPELRLGRRAGGEAGELGAGRGQAEAAFIGARVVAADRDDEQIVRIEAAAHPREGGGAAAGEEGLIFGDEAATHAVDVAVAGEGAADREIVVANAQDLRHRVDEIGAVREAAIGIDGGRRDADQPEEIAGIRIAVAEGDDPRHRLRRCGRRAQARRAERHGRRAKQPRCRFHHFPLPLPVRPRAAGHLPEGMRRPRLTDKSVKRPARLFGAIDDL